MCCNCIVINSVRYLRKAKACLCYAPAVKGQIIESFHEGKAYGLAVELLFSTAAKQVLEQSLCTGLEEWVLHSCARPRCTAAQAGISVPCCAAFSCLRFSTRVQHSLVESSTSGGKVRGGLSEVEIKPSGWHRIRLSCLSCCTTATAELEIFVFTLSLKRAREQCCAIKHCVCFLPYTQDLSFITLCFVSILGQCHLPSRFFGKTCERMDTYIVLSVIFK